MTNGWPFGGSLATTRIRDLSQLSTAACLPLPLAEPKGPSFVVDMRDVMGYVLDFGLEHFLKCD
jgi:hypothetical protein